MILLTAFSQTRPVQSNTVTLRVTSLKITRQPQDVTVDKIGDTATVSVSATGEGLTYQWFYKYTNSTEFKASSNKTNTLTYEIVGVRNGAQVYCVVKDAYGNSVQSDIATLRAAKLEITRTGAAGD